MDIPNTVFEIDFKSLIFLTTIDREDKQIFTQRNHLTRWKIEEDFQIRHKNGHLTISVLISIS